MFRIHFSQTFVTRNNYAFWLSFFINLAILYLNAGFNQNGVATYYANVTVPLLVAGQRRMRM